MSHETFPRTVRAGKDKVNNKSALQLMCDETDVAAFVSPPSPSCLLLFSLLLATSLLCVYSCISYILPSWISPPFSLSPFLSVLPQWVPTLADTAARRPRAAWSPTPASCPWPSPLTVPSPEKDSPPTTPSGSPASPLFTKMRVSIWVRDGGGGSGWCGG